VDLEQIALAGALAPAGTLARNVFQQLVAALTPAGELLQGRRVSIAGALTPAGTVIRRVAQFVNRRLFQPGLFQPGLFQGASTVAPSGTESKAATQTHASTTTPSGTVLRKWMRSFVSAVASAGVLTFEAWAWVYQPLSRVRDLAWRNIKPSLDMSWRSRQRDLAASITPPGGPQPDPTELAFGSVNVSVGSLLRVIRRRWAGAVTPSGTRTDQAQPRAASATTPSGTHTSLRQLHTGQAGVLTPAGGQVTLGPIRLSSLTSTAATVQWWVQPAASGRIEYGTDAGLVGALLTNKQVSPLSYHSQSPGNGNPSGSPALDPGTTYYYRIAESTTAEGVTAEGEIHSFETTGGTGPTATGPQPAPYTPDTGDADVYVLPGSIADDGTGDQTSAITSYLNSLPNDSIVMFDQTESHTSWTAGDTPNSVYRCLSAIRPTKRLTLWGFGSKILWASTGTGLTDGGIYLDSNANDGTKILGFHMLGTNTASGTHTAHTDTLGQAPHGVALIDRAIKDVEVADCLIEYMIGDCIYKSAWPEVPQDDVGGYWIHHNRLQMTGRQGITCNVGSPTVTNDYGWKIEWNEIWDIGLYPIDAEDSRRTANALEETYIEDNDFRRWNWEAEASFNNRAHVISIGYKPGPDGDQHVIGTFDGFYVRRNTFGAGAGDGPQGFGGIGDDDQCDPDGGVIQLRLNGSGTTSVDKTGIVIEDNTCDVDVALQCGRFISIGDSDGAYLNDNIYPGMTVQELRSTNTTGNDAL